MFVMFWEWLHMCRCGPASEYTSVVSDAISPDLSIENHQTHRFITTDKFLD